MKIKIYRKILEVLHNQTFKKYFYNTGWLLSYRIISMFVSLFVGVWVARYLGPEHFGLLSYAQAFVGLFIVFSTLGLDSIVVRELVKNENERDLLLGSAFGLKLIGAVILIILTTIVSIMLKENSFNLTLILILSLSSIFQSLNVIDFYFQSKVISKYTVYSNFLVLLLSSSLKVLLILLHQSLIYFALMFLLDAFILSFGLFIFYNKQNLKIINWKFKKNKAFRLLKESIPIIIGGVMITIYMRIDQVMIKVMMNELHVGLYSAAVRISEGWYFIPMAITSSIAPYITESKLQGNSIYYKRLEQLYKILILISLLISTFILFFSGNIVNLLFGHEYAKSSSVLIIHVFSSVFVFTGVVSGLWLLNEKLLIYGTINTMIGAIINVILNFILIDSNGIEGAAIATLISYSFSGFLCFGLFKKTRPNFINLLNSMLFINIFSKQNYRD